MSDDIQTKMASMMAPIDAQLLICQNRNEELMLACAMLQRVKEIFDTHLSPEGTKLMFKDLE
jgi:hypothetical protein